MSNCKTIAVCNQKVSNLCRLFCSYAAAYADYDIWNNDDCFLCALQYCRQHFGIPLCAENL